MSKVTGVRAKIYFLRPDEGGRRTPVVSGYRPHFHFEQDVRSDYDGAILLEDREQASPGDECVVRIEFHHPEYVRDYLTTGATFTAREGSRVVAKVTVLELISEPTEPGRVKHPERPARSA